jgi:predicted secreted hydrolase
MRACDVRLLLAFMLSALLPWLAPRAASGAPGIDYPEVRPETPVELPRDHGAHPDHRVEWWYVTGWLETSAGEKRETLGFQVTFFRVRPGVQEANPSRFAASQLLFAHAALSDPRVGRLRHAERSARAGFDLARASQGDLDVAIDDWFLRREAARGIERFSTRVRGADFGYALRFDATQPPLLNGVRGFSQKAPDAHHASHYYSLPHLAVSGQVTRDGRTVEVSGSAWLDHEWSSAYMPPGARGWDWTGIALADGGALMAFRIRDAEGKPLWAGGTLRRADGRVETFGPSDASFEPLREWRSPRTGANYPVAMRLRLRTARGPLAYELQPLFDDQELDSTRSTGAVYWEGAVRALIDGREAGRGYLELTGYRERLRM